MHIYLEGADCVGKSTFAYALTSRFEYSYLHRGPLPHDWELSDYISWIGRPPTVFDRLLLSEQVYAIRCKRHLSVNNRDYHRLINLMGATGVQVVMVADRETLERRYNPSRELYTLAEIIEDNDAFLSVSKNDAWKPLQTMYLSSEFAMGDTDAAVDLVAEFMGGYLQRSTNGAVKTARTTVGHCGRPCEGSCRS